MKRAEWWLLAIGLTVFASPVVAQVPQATAAGLEAGSRVSGFTMSPATIDLTRGDTILVRFTAIDDAGQAIEGARLGLSRSTNSFDVTSIRDSIPNAYRLWGNVPGEYQFQMSVQRADSAGGFQWSSIGAREVKVREWPAASIAIEEPGYRPYVGTMVRMSGAVLTDRGTEHATAEIEWHSSNSSVASVTPSGVVSFWRPGELMLDATTVDGVSATYSMTVVANPGRQINVSNTAAGTTRTGDVVQFRAEVLDEAGRPVDGMAISYAVHGMDGPGAVIFDDGAFVAEEPGAYKVVITAGALASESLLEVSSRGVRVPVELVGRGTMSQFATSDLWAFTGKDGRDYVYTGTMPANGGEHMFAWDVTDPANIVKTDSVRIDARRVNDVKVNPDASWAIITGENSSNRRNGITVLDLTDPAHPQVIGELTEGMTGGVHNVWIMGDIVYTINDGTLAMDIVDMADPANPEHIGTWELRPGDTNKYLHDVWSDGQYAYLSYWNDGVVILDVGAGTHGGSVREPAFVSSFGYNGNTHVVWRDRDYLFMGDEIFGCAECINGPRGYVHVVDVSDIEHPVEVARYEVPEAGTHNLWVEDEVLYIAYYQGGLRIVDVSGELRGDLYRQGREIGWYHTAAQPGEGMVTGQPMAWGPQPFKGNVFVSDLNSGLWVLHYEKPERPMP